MVRHRLLIAMFLTAWSLHAEAQIAPPLGNPNAIPTGIAPNGQQQPAFISQTDADLQAQAQGNFPPLQRDPSAPLGAIQESWNRPEPSSGQIAPGIVRYVWRPDYVMAVRTREFMTTTLELPQWENVSEIILGDTTIFEAQPIRGKPYIIAIRPLHSGADTNMTVIGTSGNIYNFYLRSEGWNSKNITDFTVYIMANPEAYNAGGGGSGGGQPINALTGQPFQNNTNAVQQQPMYGAVNSSFMGVSTGRGNAPDYIRSIAFDPANLRFDMKIYAPSPEDIEIAPLRAFTDGIWTYFDYGDKAETVRRPVVFRVVDGVDSMVNTRTAGPNGNIIIAEAVGNFTLRNGDRVVCVYQAGAPRTFDGSRGMPPSVPSNDPSLFFNARPAGEAAPGLGEQYGMPQGGVNRQPNFAQGNAGRIPGSPQIAGPIIQHQPQQVQQPQFQPQFQQPQQPQNYSQAYGGYGGSIIGGPPSIGGPQPFAQQQQWPQYSMPAPGYAPMAPSQMRQPQAFIPPQAYPIPQRLPGGGYSANDYQRALQPLRGVPTVQANQSGSSFGISSRQPNTMGGGMPFAAPVPQQPTPWSGQPAQNNNAGWMK
ncbi:MAG: TrbG/VirB9 family P-type conjugative transfer protein [Holosporales bacterium]|jgi:type IV secretory pathway VirB9-like protein|nr:TrbG/VirB9 family P-type conjugative transfer protein [Thalassospira sp.]